MRPLVKFTKRMDAIADSEGFKQSHRGRLWLGENDMNMGEVGREYVRRLGVCHSKKVCNSETTGIEILA